MIEINMTSGIMGAYTYLNVIADEKGNIKTFCSLYPEKSPCVIPLSSIVIMNRSVTDILCTTPRECSYCPKCN